MGDKRSWIGSTLNDGTPVLRITVAGPNGTKEFEAILDTGFNGFLSLPQVEAEWLGLEPQMTEKVTLADNSEHLRPIAITEVQVLQELRAGSVFLEPHSNEVLLGVEFVIKFNRVLLFSPNRHVVRFLDLEVAKKLIRKSYDI